MQCQAPRAPEYDKELTTASSKNMTETVKWLTITLAGSLRTNSQSNLLETLIVVRMKYHYYARYKK